MRPPEVSGNARPCIAIVHTDISPNPTPDDADTILQAQFISRTLNELGYHAPLLPFRPKTLQKSLQQCNAIAVFNLVEAVGGDDERATEGPLFFEKIGNCGDMIPIQQKFISLLLVLDVGDLV